MQPFRESRPKHEELCYMHIYILVFFKSGGKQFTKKVNTNNLVNILHENCNIQALAALYDKEINVQKPY